jgi:TetR/AcrR family transcriptional regulator, transcriptional repressor for nem operon
MGRDRQFDEEQVLAAATEQFATYGYNGTSLSMLAAATGLGKQSLYNAFGDKQSLYLKTVDCSVAKISIVIGQMRSAKTGRAALALLFSSLVQSCQNAEMSSKTCMISAGLLEGVEDAEVRLALAHKWTATHELLRSTIERGQKDGSIVSKASTVTLADHFMSIMSGMRVTARVDAAADRLADTIALQLKVLDVA